ncbi:MAG: glutamine synthetase type III [Lentisphaerae bacterium]|nr:glutamine synthetase type III [Lentisphaerota bacterium]
MTTKNSAMKAKADQFGENVFSLKTMRNYLSERAYKSLASTIVNGSALNAVIADEVADAMKTWALEKGATHFTHWFQPLTGITAEKHDSFFMPDREGGILAQFSGKELIQGEPDASSFPSGGLRATFEARGYTAWDPTSPAFIKDFEGGSVLCIPTIFCGYYGDALDKKTPLLRSQRALCEQLDRMAKLFGIECTTHAYATLGPEQEYFLIDLEFFKERPDLIQCGRTLFGCRPARHQQLEDHYFGNIKPRVISFMAEVDSELWRLGVPAKTRHNEVAPAQFELAPVFEEQNLAVDHNMITMMVLQEVAARHGLACLLHEKPFAGVNGSGKHNNWAVSGPDGKNWLSPGSTPHDNAKFLTMIAAIIKGVDTFAGLLRATVATAGNDHRLGANEAPPAIISIFLGEQLTDIFEQIAKGGAKSSKHAGVIELGVSTIPQLPRDATDRNRTSPMAFTGNKFEFRAVGSNQSCAGTNVALNAIVAWALDEICTELEASKAKGGDFNATLQKVLKAIVQKHKRVLFDGDGYSDAWKREAAKRGLPNLTYTPEALKELLKPDVVELFETYKILSKRELHSRYEIYAETYVKTIAMEAECALRMARTMIAPAAIEYAALLANGAKGPAVTKLNKRVQTQINALLAACDTLEAVVKGHNSAKQIAAIGAVRDASDALENIVPESLWPLPGYGEMFFLL